MSSGIPLDERTRAKLVAARKAADITQAGLAATLNVQRVTIVRIESGSSSPRQELLDRWCDALGLTCQVEIKIVVKIARKR